MIEWKESLFDIVKKAGDEILKIYSDIDQNTVKYKEDLSPITLADKASNHIICTRLKKLTPDIPIISEENKQIPYSIRSQHSRYWLVDPLDGTKEFINRNGEFTVNIALVEKNEVIMGIVQVPVTGQIFWAAKSYGSYEYSEGKEQKLSCSKFRITDKNLRVVCSRSHLSTDTKKYLDKLNQAEIIQRGSSLKFVEIAKGNVELYPRLGPTMEWDTAAAQIIVEEAGGKVNIFGSQSKMTYNKLKMTNPHFLASGQIEEK